MAHSFIGSRVQWEEKQTSKSTDTSYCGEYAEKGVLSCYQSIAKGLLNQTGGQEGVLEEGRLEFSFIK